MIAGSLVLLGLLSFMDMGILWPYIGMLFLIYGLHRMHYVSIVLLVAILISPKFLLSLQV